MNPSRSALPKAQRVDHSLYGLRILSFKPVHCGAGRVVENMQIRPAPTPTWNLYDKGRNLIHVKKSLIDTSK
jgi:hypothetical protein